MKCGNKVSNEGEECDGGLGCLDNCKCEAGYEADPADMTKLACSCKNSPFFPATFSSNTHTVRCGNDKLDNNELCDGGEGCTETCTCLSGFEAIGETKCGRKFLFFEIFIFLNF